MAKRFNYDLRYKRRVLLKYDEFGQNKYKTANFFLFLESMSIGGPRIENLFLLSQIILILVHDG